MSSLLTIPDGLLADYRSETVDTPNAAFLDDAATFLESLWSPRFPSAELVDQAAALLPHVTRARHAMQDEGPHPFITVGPGMIAVNSKDFARAERTAEREIDRHEKDVDYRTGQFNQRHAQCCTEWHDADDEMIGPRRECIHLDDPFGPDLVATPTRFISEFSRRSRTRMRKYLSQLDFEPMYRDRTRRPAMITLTYPGDWLTVVPTGQVLKAQMKKFRKRFERAWGETLYAVWKLEFQRRGAPHIHMLMIPPHGEAGGLNFKHWLSRTWAAVVAHPDPEEYRKHVEAGTGIDFTEGLRARDPKRVADYFAKHGLFRDKEYQHIVPEEWQQPGCTPGRFWGYWGVQKKVAVVEVDQDVATLAGRTLRRWSAAQGVTREVTRPRYKGGQAVSEYPEVIGLAGKLLMLAHSQVSYRKVRTRARYMKNNRGFVLVNDGAAMAEQLARSLDPSIGSGEPGYLP
jgi:hypothetical protein